MIRTRTTIVAHAALFFSMMSSAAADLVQAYPLVSTVWDVVLFQEFIHVKPFSGLGALLFTMYLSYLGGTSLLAASSVA